MTRSTRSLLFALILSTFSCTAAHVHTANVNPSTVTAASCNVSDVQDAVNQAQDSVTIPAGTCTWTSTLTITKAINLIGAGEGNTVIIDNVDKSSCPTAAPAIQYNTPLSDNAGWRMTGFTVQEQTPDPGACSQHIDVLTGSHAFRVDHISVTNMAEGSTGITVDGDPWGVIDHVTMQGDKARGVHIFGQNWGNVGRFGDNSWAQPDTMGTEQAVYVEDFTTQITNANGHGDVACERGGRCVVRHSTIALLGTHGTDSNRRPRSVRQFEAYLNTFTDSGTTVANAGMLRGGTMLFWGNTIVPTSSNSYNVIPMSLELYREVDQWSPWGPSSNSYIAACDGTGAFDKNEGVTYDSGTASRAATDTLTDSGKNWTTNQWIGYSIHNFSASPQWGSTIISNTATTIVTQGSAGYSTHPWTTGDSYKILRAYPCVDQIGRGAGAYISGGDSAHPATPSHWPNQAIDPVYAWMNTKSGVEIDTLATKYSHVVANRDYYDWNASFNGTTGVGEGLLSARPATCTPLVAYWATDTNTLYQCATTNTWTEYYTPYTYPHPLTQE